MTTRAVWRSGIHRLSMRMLCEPLPIMPEDVAPVVEAW